MFEYDVGIVFCLCFVTCNLKSSYLIAFGIISLLTYCPQRSGYPLTQKSHRSLCSDRGWESPDDAFPPDFPADYDPETATAVNVDNSKKNRGLRRLLTSQKLFFGSSGSSSDP